MMVSDMRNMLASTRLRLWQLILLLVAGFGSSCINESSVCPDDVKNGETGWITIEIQNFDSKVTGTRAQTDPDKDSHPAQEGYAAENSINPGDLKILILDDRKLVRKAYDASNFTIEQSSGNQAIHCRIKMKLDLGIFNYAKGEEIPLSLLVIANASSTGFGPSDFNAENFVGRTALEISKEKTGFPYVIAADHAWRPDGNSQYIPMSGMRHYVAKRSLIEVATSDAPYKIGGDDEPIRMQRAMAKIRVFSDEVDNEKFRISGVSVNGVNLRGAIMPDFDMTRQDLLGIDWSNGTEQVELATVRPEWFSSEAKAEFSYTDTETSLDGKHSGAWLLYIPEYALAQSGESILTLRTITDRNETRDYTYSFSRDFGLSNLTRNHIYEFTISRSETAAPEIRYTVCPWVMNTVDIPVFD